MANSRNLPDGFTLVEMLVSMAISSIVVAGSLSLFIWFNRSYRDTTLMRNTSARGSLALERMIYGVGTNTGLRAAKSSTIAVTYPSSGWRIAYNTNLVFQYTPSTKLIVNQAGKVVCTNVASSTLNYYTNSCELWVTVTESAGGRTSTNVMSTFVKFRN